MGEEEKVYHVCDGVPFGTALEAMKNGRKVARKGWNGPGMCLQYQFPDEHSKMSFPYLYLTIATGAQDCKEGERRLPWQPAQVDLFQEDWFIINDKGDS